MRRYLYPTHPFYLSVILLRTFHYLFLQLLLLLFVYLLPLLLRSFAEVQGEILFKHLIFRVNVAFKLNLHYGITIFILNMGEGVFP